MNIVAKSATLDGAPLTLTTTPATITARGGETLTCVLLDDSVVSFELNESFVSGEDRFRAEEERLEAALKETERKLNDLQREKDDGSNGALILSDEQREELADFSKQRIETRKRLREVRHQQAKDIEALGTRLKLLNAGLIPALIVAAAIAVSTTRRRKLGGTP